METTNAPKTDMTIANTIIAQLGGARRLGQMINAKDFFGGANNVVFKFMKGKDGINACRVTLDSSDTYTVEFLKLRGLTCKTVSSFSMVYCDQLRYLFESSTCLAIRV